MQVQIQMEVNFSLCKTILCLSSLSAQKEVLDKEYEEKRRTFDTELENKTQARLADIRRELEKNTSGILESQNGASEDTIRALEKEYAEKHTEYAHEILRRITEV